MLTHNGPAFRASPTHGYANRISPDKNVLCPRPNASSTCTPIFQFGFALSCTLTQSYRPHEVSVRRLTGLGENVADDDSLSAYRAHSQASSPRFVAWPQLPSPRTKFEIGFYTWYTAPGFKITGTKYRGLIVCCLRHQTTHPTTTRPCWAYMNRSGGSFASFEMERSNRPPLGYRRRYPARMQECRMAKAISHPLNRGRSLETRN